MRANRSVVALALAGLSLVCTVPAFAAEPVPAESGKRGWMGVILSGGRGDEVRVVDVIDGSAADKAGIQDGDRIVEIDGRPVRESSSVVEALEPRKPGDTVKLKIEREGATLDKTVTLGERGEEPRDVLRHFRHALPGFPGPGAPRVRLGLTLQELSEGLRGYFRAPKDQGVLVSEVAEGSPAARAGVKAGDIILAVNGKAVSDPAELREEVARLKGGDRAALRVLRNGAEQAVDVSVEERKSEAAGCPSTCPKECESCCKGGMLRGLAQPLPWPGEGEVHKRILRGFGGDEI